MTVSTGDEADRRTVGKPSCFVAYKINVFILTPLYHIADQIVSRAQ